MWYNKRRNEITMHPTKKYILISLGAILVLIQLIQPARNKSGQVFPTDFSKMYVVPDNVHKLLINACYDCHSNNTSYPWYANFQPVAWLMANHIKNGKANLNLSVFGSYAPRRQISKLRDMADQVLDNEMPLLSYKIIHRKARLSKEERVQLSQWLNKVADSLLAKN